MTIRLAEATIRIIENQVIVETRHPWGGGSVRRREPQRLGETTEQCAQRVAHELETVEDLDAVVVGG